MILTKWLTFPMILIWLIMTKKTLKRNPRRNLRKNPRKNVDIELKDDAEFIFLYEVKGDKTPPLEDVSSDSVSSESESEDEEVDVAPEATVGTITQKPYAIHDFLRGLFKASRARAKVMEAELGTCQTEIALLKSKDKIREKERELLNHDLKNVERALGNVLERVSVLESGKNATLKKRLVETETKLVWSRMERDTAERRLHESRVWNRMFYLDMVRIGAVLKLPSNDEDTERPRKKSKNSTSDGTEGPSELRGPPNGDIIMPPKAMSEARTHEIIRDQVTTSMAEFVANMNRGAGGAGAGGAGVGGTKGAIGLCQWFEKLESVFRISDCKELDKVKFATATLQGRALTIWNGRISFMGIDAANGTPWTEVRKWMTEEFCPRSVLQRLEQELYNLKLKGTDIDGYYNTPIFRTTQRSIYGCYFIAQLHTHHKEQLKRGIIITFVPN
nr:putative reverse transcriptase domain-containing protein [Tanacetum cinerariifolium]